MQPRDPGWYQDPTGRTGDARWWDGSSWIDQTRVRELSAGDATFGDLLPLDHGSATGAHTVYSPGTHDYQVITPSAQEWQAAHLREPIASIAALPPVSPRRVDGPKRSWRSRSGLASLDKRKQRSLLFGASGIGVIAIILVILVFTGAFTATNPDAAGPVAVSIPPSSTGKDVRIIDKASGISYDYLGEGWTNYTNIIYENQSTVGEFVVTQKTVPGGGEFIAQVTSGLLATKFGNPSAAQYPTTLQALEASVRAAYYPQPNTPTNPAQRTFMIDGHQASRRSFDLKWSVPGYDSTGERVVLILLDTAKSAPVFIYCSFPNTHAELYPLIDQVIASIKVDQ